MLKTNLNESTLIKKYSPILESVETGLKNLGRDVAEFDSYKKYTLSRIMENAQNLIETYSKNKAIMEAGTFQVNNVPAKNQYLKLTAAVYPQLVAENVASVQAMEYKDATCYYLGYTYGDNRGEIKAGDSISTVFQVGPDSDKYAASTRYASEAISQEELVVEAGEAKLAWGPVIPGSVAIDIDGTGATIVTDDGLGALSDGGAIDYATGTITGATIVEGAKADYKQNLEYAPAQLPSVSLDIKPLFLHAKPKALRTAYSLIGAFDLQQTQGLDAQKLLSNLATDELRCEIDGEILNDIASLPASAAAGVVTWNMEVPFGINKKEHYESLYFKIIEAGSIIKQVTRKYEGNRVIAGFNANYVLKTLDEFKAASTRNSVGPVVSGTLAGDYTVIYNPYIGEDDFTVLYQGQTFDTAYIYGVYMPIVSSQFIMDDTLLGRQGYATEYAKSFVNRKYVVKGKITHNVA
jgi:hypothetical protein|nr:MAG TPA: major capsid protein [Caudoviricetes sp.]